MDSFIIIENYSDIYYYSKYIERTSIINYATHYLESNVLVIYFDNELISYFKNISSLYNGKITKFYNYKQIIYTLCLYDIYILEYLSTLYPLFNKNNKLYHSYKYLYDNQLRYLKNKDCDKIEYMI